MLPLLLRFHRGWFFLWCLVIILIYFWPGHRIPGGGFLSKYHFDKIIHFALFFTWLLLYFWSNQLQRWPNFFNTTNAIVSFFFVAISFEILQGFWGVERTFDFRDIVANCLGATIGYIQGNKIVLLILKRIKQT
jgi:glycopeptide antibiotics resistance protein